MTQQLVVGIDIGGTNTAFGLIDRRGNIPEQQVMPTNKHEQVEDFIEELATFLQPMIDRHGGTENIKGIGVGAPNGNYYKGTIEFAPNLRWKGVIRLGDLLYEKLGVHAMLTNDANAAAIGEMIYGAARGMKNFIVVTLGTGLGSGIVVNGELLYGDDGFAGELGHIIYDYKGRLCGCGRKGCLETYASATGIVKTVHELIYQNHTESVLKNIPSEKLSAKNIYDAAATHDALAVEAFRFTAEVLGHKLADVVSLFSPEAIILFGGLAKSGPLLFDPVKMYMEEQLMPIFKNKVKLLPSELPEGDAAILGAGALAWEIDG